MNVVSIYMKSAILAYALLLAGLLLRKRKKLHAPLMTAGMLTDMLIVLVLEFKRSAIHTALSFSLTSLQQTHIAVSTMAVLLYMPVIFLGVLRYHEMGGNSLRLWHIRLGLTAFIFRTAGLFFMFSFK